MKIYVNGDTGQESHDNNVELALKQGWQDAGGSLYNLTVIRSTESISQCMETAKNAGASFVHRSYTGASSNISLSDQYYPYVILSMPPGSNSQTQAFNKSIPQTMLVISSGDNGINETAWNTEFVEPDPITNESSDPVDKESFSSSYGLGKIAYIMYALGCTSWEARYRARMTGSENGVWHDRNGYGQINVQDAINYTGEIAPDPFANPGNISVVRTIKYSTNITIDTIQSKDTYNFKLVEDDTIIDTFDNNNESFTYDLPKYGSFKLYYKSNRSSKWSEPANISYGYAQAILAPSETITDISQISHTFDNYGNYYIKYMGIIPNVLDGTWSSYSSIGFNLNKGQVENISLTT